MRRMFSLKQLEDISKKVIESGLVDNAKPIYYHPISISSEAVDGENESRIQLLILDNNSTAYTKTTLIAKLQSLMDLGALINVNGYVKYESTLYPVYMFLKSSDNYNVYFHSTTGRYNVNINTILGSSASITDGVNKIN